MRFISYVFIYKLSVIGCNRCFDCFAISHFELYNATYSEFNTVGQRHRHSSYLYLYLYNFV